MTDKIALTPLYGLKEHQPLCYLLEFGGCRILLDCGWDYNFVDSDISNLNKIGNVDYVLISHATIQHLGALPYAVSKLGISCTVYSTLPTMKMGLMFMYDAYQSIMVSSPNFDRFTIDDVDQAFSQFVTLKFYQSYHLKGNGEGITITAMNAGNTIGGTIWKISRETDDIYYAVDYNHKVERHLNGSHINAISRPSLLITDCLNFDIKHSPRFERDSLLLKSVMKCLVEGGDVLLPTDTAGRSLELLLILHSHWLMNNLVSRFSLVFLSHTAKHTLDFANSMLEWMSDECQKKFDQTKQNPFNFEFLRICTKMADLDFVPKPRVILATNPFLENGFSHELFLGMCGDPKNLVILTQRAPKETIAGKLIRDFKDNSVEYCVKEIVPLEGEELEEHLQFKKEEEIERNQLAKTIRSKTEQDVVILDEKIFFNPKKGKKRIFKKKNVTQIYPMFNCPEKNIKSDEYGEFVDYDALFREIPNYEGDGVISVEFSKKRKKFIKKDEWNSEISNEIDHLNYHYGRKLNDYGPKRPEQIPTKMVTRFAQAQVHCSIRFIDFEGRSDGDSILNILNQISPRKLVLVRGKSKNASVMRKALWKQCESIAAPKISHRLDVSSRSVVQKLVLDENLANGLHFSAPIQGYKISSLRGELTARKSFSGIPIISRKTSETGEMKEFTSLFFGNPKLSQLKKELTKEGIKAELARRELQVGNGVGKGNEISIKKVTAKDFFISGNVSEEYFRTRRVFYSLFDVV